PPGTVMVSDAPGTSGPLAWYCNSEGDRTAHDPATGGFREGIGLLGARSVENCTEIVEPASTLVPLGETEVTAKAGGGGVGFAPALVPKCSTATNPLAARRTATAQTVSTIQVRDRFLLAACSPEL